MTELEIISEQLDKACCPEDVFGVNAAMVPHIFKDFARILHPDRNPAEEALARTAFQAVSSMRQIADQRIEDGTWGKRIPLPHCAMQCIGAYNVHPKPKVGDIADIFRVAGGQMVVKMARHHDDNDLMRAEASALRLLKGIQLPVKEGVPVLLDSFQVNGQWKREANVIPSFPGFYTAQEIHGKTAVDARTAVWMFKRILVLLTWVHHFHLIHGAILPPHVLFYPDNDEGESRDPRKHSVRLIDWCYSVDYTQRTRLSSWVPSWKNHYTPEILSKTRIGPASDIYMAAMLMRYLCSDFPGPLDRVLVKCTDVNPEKRFQKAQEALEHWTLAAKAIYGVSHWHDFNLPK